MKKLNNLLSVIVIVALATSILAIILLHLNLFDRTKYNFSFTVSGIELYLSQYGNYKGLFTLTIASVAALSALKSLGESIRANNERIKQDRFMEWKNALEVRIKEVIEKDPYIDRTFIQHRYELFCLLHRLDFDIKNKNQLTEVFNVFKNAVNFLEDHNEQHLKLGGIYRDNQHSYAYDSFRFVLYGGIGKGYTDAEIDLNKLFVSSLNSHRIINKELYEGTIGRR